MEQKTKQTVKKEKDILFKSITFRQKRLSAMIEEYKNVRWWRFIKLTRLFNSCKELLNDIDKDISVLRNYENI